MEPSSEQRPTFSSKYLRGEDANIFARVRVLCSQSIAWVRQRRIRSNTANAVEYGRRKACPLEVSLLVTTDSASSGRHRCPNFGSESQSSRIPAPTTAK